MVFCRFGVILTIIIFLAMFNSSALAQGTFSPGMYFGGSFAKHRFKDSFDGLSLTGVVLKVGYDIAPFLAIEGHAGGTIKEHYFWYSQGQLIGEYDLRAEHAALYARLNWHLRNVTLYGLVGSAYYKVIVDDKVYDSYDVSYSSSESGLSYGLGIDLFGSRRAALSLNWMKLINEEDKYGDKMEVDAVYIGITYYLKPQKTTHPIK